jgi:Zn-dependent M28 family amino/carboxypeptidase
MGLALAAGMLMVAEGLLPEGAARLTMHWLAVLATLPAAAYGVGMGANLAGGRLSPKPSTGAVDNGAAVAVLLALAQRLSRGEVSPSRTSVTLLFTVGEEAQMQGALSYVRDREAWPLPACAVNLEVAGQNGGYLLWEQDGTAMQRMAADPDLNRALAAAIQEVAGEQPVRARRISSDAYAFLRRGIPAATLGSFDAELGGRGFHSALDNVDRIDTERLAETVDVLARFLLDLDSVTEGDHTMGAG